MYMCIHIYIYIYIYMVCVYIYIYMYTHNTQQQQVAQPDNAYIHISIHMIPLPLSPPLSPPLSLSLSLWIQFPAFCRSSKGWGVAIHVMRTEGPRTSAPFWDWGPAIRNPNVCRGLRSGQAKLGSWRRPRPSRPQAGRPASGPASPRPCRSPREIPRATPSIGWRAGSPALRRPQMAPAGRWASPTVRPQRPAGPCPAAAQGCSRLRGAPLQSLAARLTLPPGGLRPDTGDLSSLTPGGQGAGHGGLQAARRAHPD